MNMKLIYYLENSENIGDIFIWILNIFKTNIYIPNQILLYFIPV